MYKFLFLSWTLLFVIYKMAACACVVIDNKTQKTDYIPLLINKLNYSCKLTGTNGQTRSRGFYAKYSF